MNYSSTASVYPHVGRLERSYAIIDAKLTVFYLTLALAKGNPSHSNLVHLEKVVRSSNTTIAILSIQPVLAVKPANACKDLKIIRRVRFRCIYETAATGRR